MKILTLTLGIAVLFWASHKIYDRKTQFGLEAKFSCPTFSSSAEWEMPPLGNEEQQLVDAILCQKFTFLARGSQAFAFISEDKQYVLKLFKQHKWRPGNILGYIPLPFNPYYKSYLSKQQKQYDVLHSCKTALTHVKEDTGVLYAHLNPTPVLTPPVTLIDKHGKSWTIDLSNSCFLLQKKADLFYEHIQDLMSQSLIEDAKYAITSTIKLIDRFIDLGVYENNAILRKNFGFINNEAMQFDIGKFKFDNTEKHVDKREIRILTKNFRRWIGTHYPELEEHFDTTLDAYSPVYTQT